MYLAYIRVGYQGFDNAIRDLVRFLIFEDEDRYGRFLLPIMEIGD